MKPLLVGESNPYGGDPAFALYPSPPGCAGLRHQRARTVPMIDRERLLGIHLPPRLDTTE
jgi:hypothetical protein